MAFTQNTCVLTAVLCCAVLRLSNIGSSSLWEQLRRSIERFWNLKMLGSLASWTYHIFDASIRLSFNFSRKLFFQFVMSLSLPYKNNTLSIITSCNSDANFILIFRHLHIASQTNPVFSSFHILIELKFPFCTNVFVLFFFFFSR